MSRRDVWSVIETVWGTKSAQDEFAAREAALLAAVAEFRAGFIGLIEKFAQTAVNEDLAGTAALEVKQAAGSLFEATATLNSFPLVIVAPQQALFSDASGTSLSAKILLFPDSGADAKLHAEVAVSELTDGHCYSLRWFPREKPVGIRFAGGRGAASFEGALAAQRFIEHLYSFVQYWDDAPMVLGDLRALAAGRRAQFGFAPPG